MGGVKLKFLILFASFTYVFASPLHQDYVVSRFKKDVDAVGKEDGAKGVKEPVAPPKISEMLIKSNISNRFATTVVTSRVKNAANIAQETNFFVIIPDKAFISGFIMEIDNKNYTAYVQQKEEAKKTYEQAVSSGYGAAHVSVSARDSNRFSVSVNIEPESKAIFYLTYEELLERSEGRYELVINIHPKQLVKNLNVEVDINESRPLTSVVAPAIRSGNEIGKESDKLDSHAVITKPTENSAVVKFNPDYEQQKQIAQGLGTIEDEGMAGQFVVQYDVERDPNGGEVLLKDGYFVHFFAPSDVVPLNKHIVFVLDTSGSMYDRKLEQLKTAMRSILGELKPKDLFNLVEFNTNVKVWNLDAPLESTSFPNSDDNWYVSDKYYELKNVSFPPAYPVNNNTIKKATKAINDMISTGGTNIYEAMRVGIHLIKVRQQRNDDKSLQPLIVFLTDGDPTIGKTNLDEIIGGVSEENVAKIPIISLSFGNGADRNFLQKMSLRNFGFARHIYEDSDASLQLENFYAKISSPLLSNVKFVYTPDAHSLTRTEYPILFKGNEFVVAGVIDKEFKEPPMVTCWNTKGLINLHPTVQKTTGQLERLWAYLTVRNYLDAKEVSANKTVYEKKALDLALKYSFVTSLTSLVVVKPNATTAPVDAEAADKSGGGGYPVAAFGLAAARPAGLPGSPVYSSPPHYAALPPAPAYHSPISYPTSPASGFVVNGRGASRRHQKPHTNVSSSVAFGAPGAGAAGGAPLQFEAEEDTIDLRVTDLLPQTEDRIYGGAAISTTEPTTTTLKPFVLPDNLKNALPWLEGSISPDGTLNFFKGKYTLGLNTTLTDPPADCTTAQSTPGQCTLLESCTKLYPVLTGQQQFKDYFCSIDNKYAGVCCTV